MLLFGEEYLPKNEQSISFSSQENHLSSIALRTERLTDIQIEQ